MIKEESKKKLSKSELLISIYIIILTISKTIGFNSSQKIYLYLFAFGTILALFKIINEKYSRREILIISSLLTIGILDFMIGKETTILFTALVISCLKNINVNKMIKIIFYVKVITFIIILFLIAFKFIDNNYILFYRDGEIIKRYSLIYSHPNMAQLNLCIILITWMYLYYDKINFFNIAIAQLLNYLLYMYTLSRTGFLIAFVSLIFFYFHKKNKLFRNIISRIGKNYYIYMFLITLIFGLLYGKVPLINSINNLLTGRIYYINYFLKNIKVPLIGKEIYSNNMIDNGYISIMYNGGIFATIWFTFFVNKTTNYLYKEKKYKELLLSIILMTYCLTESFYPNVILNISLLFLAYYIFEDDKKRKEKINFEKRKKSNYINSNI